MFKFESPLKVRLLMEVMLLKLSILKEKVKENFKKWSTQREKTYIHRNRSYSINYIEIYAHNARLMILRPAQKLNARNTSMQHLASLLDRVVRYCKRAVQTRKKILATPKNAATRIFKFSNLIWHHPTSCNTLLQVGQTRATMLCATMLQDVPLKCCGR